MNDTFEKIRSLCEEKHDPDEIRLGVANALGHALDQVLIVGPRGHRVILIIENNREACMAIGLGPIAETAFFQKYGSSLELADPTQRASSLNLDDKTLELMQRPKIRMVALYHPENFPLPRFPLGISDIARAVRANAIGQIQLSDMQLGERLATIIEGIEKERPDIIGISATFGQQDLLMDLAEGISSIDGYEPLIVFGGSLSSLNADHLLEKYPNSIIGMGYGETTMQNIAEYWHGLRGKNEINHVKYLQDGGLIETPKFVDDKRSNIVPELDLLEATLGLRGVMQLEASRGCPYACSFCPRGHKGQWKGIEGDGIESIMEPVGRIFDKFPQTARKIFLVDEEFLGFNPDDNATRARALKVAEALDRAGFRFESSTRIDQVVHPRRNDSWHAERVVLWRRLKQLGLDRMLFGVESGVESILKRFNKQTTAEQNILGVRTLSSCGIPIRLTYITFDPLMTMDELIETYMFQGRKDILLQANDALGADELHSAVKDPDYVSTHAKGIPLYREMSYMLVSMECLLGSKYLAKVEAEGLSGAVNLNMGKKSAEYKNPDIGIMSKCSQMWIDRNFSLDYLLKSLIKVAPAHRRKELYQLRWAIKDYAYELFGMMLAVVNAREDLAPNLKDVDLSPFNEAWLSAGNSDEKGATIKGLMDMQFKRLSTHMSSTFESIKAEIPELDRQRIQSALEKWARQSTWRLIND